MKAPGWAPPLAAGTIRGKSQANTPRATLDVFVCDFPLNRAARQSRAPNSALLTAPSQPPWIFMVNALALPHFEQRVCQGDVELDGGDPEFADDRSVLRDANHVRHLNALNGAIV